MSIEASIIIIIFICLWGFSRWKSQQHAKRLKDPSSKETQRIMRALDDMQPSLKSALNEMIKSGQKLDAIKYLRANQIGLALQEAKDIVETLQSTK